MNNSIDSTSDILVFRTNINTADDLQKIADLLAPKTNIICWNVDQDDIDKVLRIKSNQLHAAEIIQITTQGGFLCEELPD